MVEEKRNIISDMRALQGIILTWMEFDADKTESRWNEIRNGILNTLSLSLNNDELNRFNMRLSRALQRLVKEEIIVKTNRGHKNTAYSLKEPLTSPLDETFPHTLSSWLKCLSPLSLYKVDLPHDIDLIKIAVKSSDYADFKEKILTAISEKIEKELREKWEHRQDIGLYLQGHIIDSACELMSAEAFIYFFDYARGAHHCQRLAA